MSELAQYPFVALEPSISTWQTVLEVFGAAGMKLNVILRATDADVVKDCVARGLGLTVLVDVAYDPAKDANITLLKTSNLFPPSVTSVVLHRRRLLPAFAYDFIEMLAPDWKRAKVEQTMARRATPAA